MDAPGERIEAKNMSDMSNERTIASDLNKEQADLLSFLESAVSPELMAAVEKAYHSRDDAADQASITVSYEGTACA